jgi:peptidoglycan/LPS O-acetylase OafA/YrhL
MTSSRSRVMAVVAGAAVLVYVGFLGWDRETVVDPATGSSSGPYDTWQIACATVALGLLAYYGGRAQHAWATSAAISVAFTTAWSVGAATTPTEDADLWAVGAVFLLIGTFLSTAAVAPPVRTARPSRALQPLLFSRCSSPAGLPRPQRR